MKKHTRINTAPRAVTDSVLDEVRPSELPEDVVWHLRQAKCVFYSIAEHIAVRGDLLSRKRFGADCENIASGLLTLLEKHGEEPRNLPSHPACESVITTGNLPSDIVQAIHRACHYSGHLAKRIVDEVYEDESNRQGISLDCDFAGGDLQFVLEQYGYAMLENP